MSVHFQKTRFRFPLKSRLTQRLFLFSKLSVVRKTLELYMDIMANYTATCIFKTHGFVSIRGAEYLEPYFLF